MTWAKCLAGNLLLQSTQRGSRVRPVSYKNFEVIEAELDQKLSKGCWKGQIMELHIQTEFIQHGMCSPSLLGKDNTSCGTGREKGRQTTERHINQFVF